MKTRGILITGTDTGIGKTYLTTLIAQQLVQSGMKVGVYKPVCTGSTVRPDETTVWEDVEQLAGSIGWTEDKVRICPQLFHAPLAPPVSARTEGKTVNETLLSSGAAWWDGQVETLLVEGVGGFLCPLTEQSTIADFAVQLGYPVLIVARLDLGTINHTLLTVEAAENRGLSVAGIVLNEVQPSENQDAAQTNPAEIAKRTAVPVLGVIPFGHRGALLQDGHPTTIDWKSVLR